MADKKREQFLKLQDFDEYLEKLAFFCGLQFSAETFHKQQELLESDERYSRREKEKILKRKQRELISQKKKEITLLMEQIEKDGVWILPIKGERPITYAFRYPDGQKGDVKLFLTSYFYDPVKLNRNHYQAKIARKDYKLLELLVLSEKYLFYAGTYEKRDPSIFFLIRYNRLARIEYLMYQINCYKEEYRNLRSLEDQKLKKLLSQYHRNLKEKSDEIYKYLIGKDLSNPRWKSEQKAFAIVLNSYPDALFQYQPDFLYGQRLDIYIPDINTAIEYQGKQHYEPVAFFGGEEGLKDNRRRDERKARRCRGKGIRLLYWDYDKPLSEAYFKQLLKESTSNNTAYNPGGDKNDGKTAAYRKDL